MRPATCKYHRGFLIRVRRREVGDICVSVSNLNNIPNWIAPAQYCQPSELLGVLRDIKDEIDALFN